MNLMNDEQNQRFIKNNKMWTKQTKTKHGG